MAKKNSKSLGCLGFILIAAAFYWFVSSEIKNKMPGGPEASGDNLVAAVREAQAVVASRLKNPKDAKWPGFFSGVDLRTHAHKNPDGSYAIKSYVDATTPLGAKKRVWFLAKATGGGVRWKISDVAIDD